MAAVLRCTVILVLIYRFKSPGKDKEISKKKIKIVLKT